MRNSLSSWARAGSFAADSFRRSAGLSMVFSNVFLPFGPVIWRSVHRRAMRLETPMRWAYATTRGRDLRHTVYDEMRKLCKSVTTRAEGLQGRDRIVAELPGPVAGRCESGRARIRRLIVGGVGPGCLAQKRGISLDIEDVILDLERQPDLGAKTFQPFVPRPFSHAGGKRPQKHTALYQRTRLAPVHVLDVDDAEVLPDGRQINRLASRHAAGSGRLSEHADHGEPCRGRLVSAGLIREDGECKRLQGVADQDRSRFVEGAMAGRAATAQIIIVHRG